MHNEHSAAIPAKALGEIEELFRKILAKLEPYRVPLTTAERKEMTIVGDKTLAFLEKGKEYTDLYPALIPAWLNKTDFAVDFDDIHNTISLRNLADQAQEAIYNIQYLAGNDAYHWMLDFYQSAKQAAARDVPNAKIVAEELGKRFHRSRRRYSPGEGDTGEKTPTA